MRVASVQMDVQLGNPQGNAELINSHLRHLAEGKVDLAIFPEAALTGYVVHSPEAARAIALTADSLPIQAIQGTVNETGVRAVVGWAELEGDKVFNTATLFEPNQASRSYRKLHLPFLGLDRFVTTGDQLEVFETELGNIGVLICFDIRFPEAARALALKGADVLVLPTNWPDGAQVSAEHICIARAAESKIFVVTCNRTGVEEGTTFIGLSKIIDPFGKVLAAAGPDEQVLIADIEPELARQKLTVIVPGEYETDAFATRRPELYGSCTS